MNIEFLMLLIPQIILAIIAAGFFYVGYSLASQTVARLCSSTTTKSR